MQKQKLSDYKNEFSPEQASLAAGKIQAQFLTYSRGRYRGQQAGWRSRVKELGFNIKSSLTFSMYELRSMGGGSLWIWWREPDGMLTLCLSTSILLSIIPVYTEYMNK